MRPKLLHRPFYGISIWQVGGASIGLIKKQCVNVATSIYTYQMKIETLFRKILVFVFEFYSQICKIIYI